MKTKSFSSVFLRAFFTSQSESLRKKGLITVYLCDGGTGGDIIVITERIVYVSTDRTVYTY